MTILEHITKARELAFKAKVMELIGDDAYNAIELALAKASIEVKLAAPKRPMHEASGTDHDNDTPVVPPVVPANRLKQAKKARV